MDQAIESTFNAPLPGGRPPYGNYPKRYGDREEVMTTPGPHFEYVARPEEPFWDYNKSKFQQRNQQPGPFRAIADNGNYISVLSHYDIGSGHGNDFYQPNKHIIGSTAAPSRFDSNFKAKMQP